MLAWLRWDRRDYRDGGIGWRVVISDCGQLLEDNLIYTCNIYIQHVIEEVSHPIPSGTSGPSSPNILN